jgi:hypothetical protein
VLYSKGFNQEPVLGSKRVAIDAVNGLRRAGIDVLINVHPEDGDTIWVHNSWEALCWISFYNLPALVGPNVAFSPENLPRCSRLGTQNYNYLVPSQWVADIWAASLPGNFRTTIWPIGIAVVRNNRDAIYKNHTPIQVLVYFKNRSLEELSTVLSVLTAAGVESVVFRYGEYEESDFIGALKYVNFCVWLAGSESQGIAMLTALAMDVPVIVLDIRSMGGFNVDRLNPRSYRFTRYELRAYATSAPYFDSRCGETLTLERFTLPFVQSFISKLEDYTPRKFVTAELSMERSVTELIRILRDTETVSDMSSVKNIHHPYVKFQVLKNRFMDAYSRERVWRQLLAKI